MRELQAQIIDEMGVRPEIDPAAEVERRVQFLVDYATAAHCRGALYPSFAQHVRAAIDSGLPSRLTRGESGSKKGNSVKACALAPTPRPAGQECDEYPFASTLEGAKTAPTPGQARTFAFCNLPQVPQGARGPVGWSICLIPKVQNQAAGSDLGKQYNEERILVGDPFEVTFE